MKILIVPLLKNLTRKEVLSGNFAQSSDIILKKNDLALYAALNKSIVNCHIIKKIKVFCIVSLKEKNYESLEF